MRFEVSEKLFEKLPDLCFGIVVVKDIDNTKEYPLIDKLLDENVEGCKASLENLKVKELPQILPYRDAFLTLGINPNKYMCSIEALLTRIQKGKGMPHINPVVNLGNAISLKYQLPIGAHDIESFKGALEVRPSVSGDSFIPFGSEETEIPDEGEIVYVSGGEVRTRRWTWRQSEIGKINPETKDVFFPIDGFSSVNIDLVYEARETFVKLVKEQFGLESSIGMVDINNRSFEC